MMNDRMICSLTDSAFLRYDGLVSSRHHVLCSRPCRSISPRLDGAIIWPEEEHGKNALAKIIFK